MNGYNSPYGGTIDNTALYSNEDVELTLFGKIMLDGHTEGLDLLQPEHFHYYRHGELFANMCRVSEGGIEGLESFSVTNGDYELLKILIEAGEAVMRRLGTPAIVLAREVREMAERRRTKLFIETQATMLENGMPLDELQKSSAHFWSEYTPPSRASSFNFLSYKESLALPPKEWLIDQIGGAGDIVVMYGPPGSGKTFALIDMVFAACLGLPFANRFAIARPLSVLYCTGEGKSGLQNRLAAAGQYYNVDDLPGFTMVADIPQLFDAKAHRSIYRLVADWKATGKPGPDILIIDTLHNALVGANENDSKDMGIATAAVKYATNELGCLAGLAHHTNRAGTGERGSGALRADAQTMIELKAVGSSFLMTCDKSKDDSIWKPQTFDLVAKAGSVRVEWSSVGDGSKEAGQKTADKESLVREMQRYKTSRFTVKQLSEIIAKSENYTRNLLTEIERAGDCARELSDPKKPASPRNSWVYSLNITHQSVGSE